MVNTSAMANSIFTYFISYNFNCDKGNKKSRISTFSDMKSVTYATQILFSFRN
ncbi:hypothetical protein BACFIN_09155 [Bacteroides finegoldii DSM 17565]|nr:hypothetical protein BACFIN_09155 [Bacteroides finegoldii DSM 17565]